MKVAVSIPEPIYQSAEVLAKRLNTSRSDLYARALDQFIGNQAPASLTQQMNDVIDSLDDPGDEFSREAARRVFRHVEW
jgi:metal-responsive CopG/Arc/MetJ family transcriptional regulator